VRHSPNRKRISYQDQLLPNKHGKYVLNGLELTVNNVTEEDAGEYHCEIPRNAYRFVVAVESQSKEFSCAELDL